MTAGLDTFAKVRALHDRAATPGEKAAAASRMEALARSAGMTVDEAVSKLDARSQSAANDPLHDFFNSPFMRETMAKRERERAERWREVLAEYGSEEAVFAPGPWEQALEQACERFVVRKTTTGWPIGSLWGWNYVTSLNDPAPEIVGAISTAYPMPASVRQAWAEFRFWDKLGRDREACGVGCGDHAPWVQLRAVLIERQLNILPAATLNDLRARLDYFDWRNDLETAPDPKEERVRLATLRADIERMGARLRDQDVETAPVQSGHSKGYAHRADPSREKGSAQRAHPSGAEGCARSEHPSRSPDAATSTAAFQSGHAAEGFTDRSRNPVSPAGSVQAGHSTHPLKEGQSDRADFAGPVRRTNADKRRDVLAMLTIGKSDSDRLTDREIARRVGVSPTTVGTIRRSLV